jgi:molybdopterin-guanine dinucleotide biosynthesis protein MobB
VGSLKHTGHDHETDVPGKDSQRHAEAGANPALFVAGSRTSVHRRGEPEGLQALIAREMPGVDVVVVEGFKSEPGFPKVEVVRAATGRAPMLESDPGVVAVVTDRETGHASSVPRLGFDDAAGLATLVAAHLGLDRSSSR